MPNAQGPGLCSTSVDKKEDHVCSMRVHVVCCNLIRLFFLILEVESLQRKIFMECCFVL